MQQSTRLGFFALLALFAGLVIYLPGLWGPLLFDDKPALTANELVQISGRSADEWRVAAFSSNSGPLRRPLAMISFAANHVATGNFAPLGLKAVNLAIHLLIAILLYFFLQAVMGSLAPARDRPTRQLVCITAAAIWLLHPLHVSTVLYAVQRMAQLSTLFALSGLLIFMHYRQRWAAQGAPTGELVAAMLWLALMTAMATLSKENGVLLPWLILVLEVAVFRGRWAGMSSRQLEVLAWVLLVLPVAAVLLILWLSPGSLTGGFSGREFTLEERLLTQARLLWRYLGWIFVPNINDMGFQHDDIPLSRGLFEPLTTFIAVVAWPLCLALAFFVRKRYPLFLLALLFFLVGHSMESSIIPLEMVYEHRNYLPSMLVCLGFAYLLVVPVAGLRHVGTRYPVLGALAILCALLFVRVQTWSDELTLSRVNLAHHPESSRSNYFYANALLRAYRRAEQLGLSERDKSEYLLMSRHYFERMYQTNNRDVAALVMLFYLDSHFFTGLQEQADWLAELDELLETRPLQASDWNALNTLFDIFASGADVASQSRVTRLLEKLAGRYPQSTQVLRYRYQYLSAINGDSAPLLPLLQRAQEQAPGSDWVYYSLLQNRAASGDIDGMYAAARLWLKNDVHRYKLLQIKAVLAEPDTSSESPHE